MTFNAVKFRGLMAEAELTIAKLSKKIGVSYPLIVNYKKGKSQPSLETITKIAQVFKVGSEELIMFEKN